MYNVVNSNVNVSNGIYTAQNQFDFDEKRLKSLGFNDTEIQTLSYIIMNGGKVTLGSLNKYGLPYEESKRLKYMYDICIGKVIIDSVDDLCKHLRKMYGNRRRIGIGDLAVSKISKVPRKAVIAGIVDSTFGIYNSKQYEGTDKMYDVINVTNTRIHILTNRKPILKYKQPKSIEGVIEILSIKDDGKLEVAINKRYIKLVNRFMIVASLRKPEYHNGLIEIVCIEGTKVYVYAQSMGTKENVSYSMGTQRVYAYGFFPSEINNKLKSVGSEIYKQICGVYAVVEPANQDFRVLTIEENEEDDDIEIED